MAWGLGFDGSRFRVLGSICLTGFNICVWHLSENYAFKHKKLISISDTHFPTIALS